MMKLFTATATGQPLDAANGISRDILSGYRNTFFYTLLGTVINVCMTLVF